MATNAEIQAWLAAHPNATDAEMAAAMNQYGVGASQLASVTGVDQATIQKRAVNAGAPVAAFSKFSPLNTTPTAPTTPAINTTPGASNGYGILGNLSGAIGNAVTNAKTAATNYANSQTTATGGTTPTGGATTTGGTGTGGTGGTGGTTITDSITTGSNGVAKANTGTFKTADVDLSKIVKPEVSQSVLTTAPSAEKATQTQAVLAPNGLVQNQVANIIDANSPLMQRAAAKANMTANSRGLLNSSLAVGSAQNAVLDAAMPIAQADAGATNQFALTNATEANRMGMFNSGETNTTNRFNTSETNSLNKSNTDAKNVAGRDYATSINNAVVGNVTAANNAGQLGVNAANQANLTYATDVNRIINDNKTLTTGIKNSFNSLIETAGVDYSNAVSTITNNAGLSRLEKDQQLATVATTYKNRVTDAQSLTEGLTDVTGLLDFSSTLATANAQISKMSGTTGGVGGTSTTTGGSATDQAWENIDGNKFTADQTKMANSAAVDYLANYPNLKTAGVPEYLTTTGAAYHFNHDGGKMNGNKWNGPKTEKGNALDENGNTPGVTNDPQGKNYYSGRGSLVNKNDRINN